MNTFSIDGRIGYLEQTGKTLKIAIYNTRVVRGQDGPAFKQQRISLVTFGPKAAEIVTQYTVGQTVKLSGFIRDAGKFGIDLIVTQHELVVKTEAQAEEPAVDVEVAREPAAEPVAEAPKARGRGRKKAA
jgi:hypothetical protein